jgi:hypothetical protein
MSEVEHDTVPPTREQEIAALRLIGDGYRGPSLAAEFPEAPPADWPFGADAWSETRAYYLGESGDK